MTTVPKTHFGRQLTFLLLHTGLVQKFIFVGSGVGWVLIKFWGFQGGCLLEMMMNNGRLSLSGRGSMQGRSVQNAILC